MLSRSTPPRRRSWSAPRTSCSPTTWSSPAGPGSASRSRSATRALAQASAHGRARPVRLTGTGVSLPRGTGPTGRARPDGRACTWASGSSARQRPPEDSPTIASVASDDNGASGRRRGSPSCGPSSGATTPSTTSRTPRRSPTPTTTLLKDELAALEERPPGARRDRLAHPDGRDRAGGALRPRHPPHADDEPRQGDHPRGDPRLGCPPEAAALARGRVALCLRAEDRRPLDLAHLRAGPPRAWRDTRRRAGGRGRDRQRAHARRRPGRARPAGRGDPRGRRDQGRGLLPRSPPSRS